MKANAKLNKLTCIVLCLLLALAVTFGLAGCTDTDNSATDSNIKTDNPIGSQKETDLNTGDNNENTRGLEWGFKFELFDGCIAESLPIMAAYKSDTDTFDIDNVTLTFYFGMLFVNEEYTRKNDYDIQELELGFRESTNQEIYTVKKVEENFVSEKYRVKYICNEKEKWFGYQFNHCEDITIPKEMFCKEQGIINFIINGDDVHTGEPEHMLLNEVSIKYEFIETNKVILSPAYIF